MHLMIWIEHVAEHRPRYSLVRALLCLTATTFESTVDLVAYIASQVQGSQTAGLDYTRFSLHRAVCEPRLTTITGSRHYQSRSHSLDQSSSAYQAPLNRAENSASAAKSSGPAIGPEHCLSDRPPEASIVWKTRRENASAHFSLPPL